MSMRMRISGVEGRSALFIGAPGTGKSHVAKAIAYAVVRSGQRVPHTEAEELLINLVQASRLIKRKLPKPSSTPTCWCSTTCSWPDASPWKALTNCNQSCTNATKL